ncbi:Hypothetical predicted protein [Cloeon dipterum]|uniref:C-type lectin domain-containing protein n=1 Tax=Cloeon dipterum TaxID=197152 RepID=A0A8S1DTD6_9INSE|nr:Hypothetical predicted protein [Cloeon dipterum]
MAHVSLAICTILLLGPNFTSAGLTNEAKASEPFLSFEYGNRTYYVYGRLVGWFSARNLCRQVGLDLASIETADENAAIFNAISSYYSKSFWLSGY